MWLAVAVMLVGSIVVAEVGRRAAAGTLPRNNIAGIRTPASLRDDESWRQVHRAGGPTMLAAGLIGAVLSLAAGAAGLLFGDGAAATVVLAAALAVLAGTLLSAWKGLSTLRRSEHR